MNNQSGQALFQKWGKLFQEKIFQGMAIDKDWAQQMHEVMKPHYFELKYLQYLCEKYFEYFDKYRCFPTMQLLIQMIASDLQDDGTEGILRSQIVQYLNRVRQNPHPEDLHHVKDEALDFCKRQAFKEALVEAVDLVEGEQFESVVDLMKNAVSVGMPSSVGHNFFEDTESRFVDIQRITTPTGLNELDEKSVLDGGLGRGELGVVVAPTGVGKSHWLVQMASEALKRGKTVVYYTFELSETLTGKRFDANLTNIPQSDLSEHKQEVLDHYKTHEYGNLIIKFYPIGAASVNTIRNHLEKLKFRGFMPSLVCIDYADLMKSSRSFDSLRHELKLIYEELRTLASEADVPIWTASQSNREGARSEIIGLENMGESYGKAQTADFVVGLSRKPEEKDKGSARIFVAKNRAGRDGMQFYCNIDTARSKFSIMDEEQVKELMVELDPKKALKEAWTNVKKVKKELRND